MAYQDSDSDDTQMDSDSDFDSQELDQRARQAQPNNTRKTTRWAVGVYRKWAARKAQYDFVKQEILDFGPDLEALNKTLYKFYSEVHSEQGPRLTPSSLQGMEAATTRQRRGLVVLTQFCRRLCVPKHGAVFLATLVLLFVIPYRTSVTRWLPRSGPQPTHEPDSDSVAEGGDDAGTLLLPIGRLVEPALPSRSWFSGDARCSRFQTRFARPGSLPDARLVSFPRSGNTWTRYLLETATGLVTCGPTFDSEASETPPSGPLPAVADVIAKRKHSLTTSAELQAAGFIAEHVSPLTRTCIIGKSHVFPPTWRRMAGASASTSANDRTAGSNTGSNAISSNIYGNNSGYLLPGVLLVRDPFRAIISLKHLSSNNSIRVSDSRGPDAAFAGANWTRFVDAQSRYWFDMANEWADGPRHTLLVSYERLVDDPEAELRRMLRFFGVTPAMERLRCVLRHVEGAFRNQEHPVLADEAVFDRHLRRMVWGRIRTLAETLVGRGYQWLPLEKYSFYGMA